MMTELAKTEKQKMLAGELYIPFDPELTADGQRAQQLLHLYNQTTVIERDRRDSLLRQLLGRVGDSPNIVPPFHCDYGSHIFLGDRVYMNYGCVILDCNRVDIGNDVLFAPYVQVYAATHPTDPALRLAGKELALPIRIGNAVWVGGGAIICPGVSIGDNTTIGAGSVVTKDIPANVVAAGNPCRVLRSIDTP